MVNRQKTITFLASKTFQYADLNYSFILSADYHFQKRYLGSLIPDRMLRFM